MSEFEIQEEVREDVFDKIIDAFTVKRRKAIIDLDQDSDLVDYEESQKRLFILATIFATILGIIAFLKETKFAVSLSIGLVNMRVLLYCGFSRKK